MVGYKEERNIMRKTVFLTGLLIASFLLFASKSKVMAEDISQSQNQSSQPIMVEVTKGDSLSKIANEHQTTYVRIFDANLNIEDPNVIHPGEKLRIPGSSENLQSRNAKEVQPQTEEIKPKVKRKKVTKVSPKPNKPKTITKKQTVNSTASPAASKGSVWDALARCESGGNWAINTGNGYYGGLQFTASTWRAVGGSGLPHQASREEQIMRGQILQSRSGWGQWPACTKKLGLR